MSSTNLNMSKAGRGFPRGPMHRRLLSVTPLTCDRGRELARDDDAGAFHGRNGRWRSMKGFP